MRKKDRTLTTNLQETLQYTLQNLTPVDNQTDNKALHKQMRALIQETIDIDDDKEFTLQEVKTAVASISGGKKKLAASSMLHEAKIAYYAFDVIVQGLDTK